MICNGHDRHAGILLSISALPGRGGIGDFGAASRQVLDQLAQAGFTQWLILPLQPTGFGNSPYQAASAFAGSHYYISPQQLVDEGLLTQEEWDSACPSGRPDQVDYGFLHKTRRTLLKIAHRRWTEAGRQQDPGFAAFCQEPEICHWLEDYACYMAIKDSQSDLPWFQWPLPLRTREPGAMHLWRQAHREEIEFWKFVQYLFFTQWDQLRAWAKRGGIQLVGDLPFYVALDSADVWAHPELFFIHAEDGSPIFTGGVPGDSFSSKDRDWGNPAYRWEAHKATGYQWWHRRMEMCCRMYDGVRMDHVIGFRKWYGIAKDGSTSQWYDGPDADDAPLTDQLAKIADRRGCFVIGEDLGKLPEGLQEHLANLGWASMRVMQFAFCGKYGAKNNHLPFYHRKDMVVFTGTHDNPTLKEFLSGKTPEELSYMRLWLNSPVSDLHWALIRGVYQSSADRIFLPVQDLLELGADAMLVDQENYQNSWKWRLTETSVFSSGLAGYLRSLAIVTGRLEAGGSVFREALQQMEGMV